MHTVSELLRTKGSVVHRIAPGATVVDAAKAMNQHKIGALVVLDGDSMVGIVTERDIMTRVVATELSPSKTPVSAIMTKQVQSCPREAKTADLRALMRERRIRHVPVVDGGRVVGMVSIGDLNAAEAQVLSQTITYLEAYISG